MFLKKALFSVVIITLLTGSFSNAADSPSTTGKLFIAGGGVRSSRAELWTQILTERIPNRPIGIISTASATPLETSANTAQSVNDQFGEGSAVAIPLSEDNDKALDPETVALIRNCGGFYFTGGQQTRTMRALLTENGARTPALEAIWEVYHNGGVIGGSSAGAAIMSDPMISGGSSSAALLRGTTPGGTPRAERGVNYLPGLGFHSGVLYCQHHLERGRFGRLLAALASDDFSQTTGVGVAEDTALLVDHARNTGTVLGAKGALYIDTNEMERRKNGSLSNIRLHYIDRGDTIDFSTGTVHPADGKESVKPGELTTLPETEDAWARDAIWRLLTDLAPAAASASAVARDENFDLLFEKTSQTEVWRQPNETEDTRPTWTITNIRVSVLPRSTAETAANP